ncbi:MAG: 30S ribosomal protein S16 [Vampirovibrionia bacterium]
MLRIRLKRTGRIRQPHYRIIVCDSKIRRDGAPVEELGYYNPRLKQLKLDKAKALDWISKGAQPSDTVKGLIEACGDDGNFSPEALAYRNNRKAKLKEAKKAQEAEKAAAEEAVSA